MEHMKAESAKAIFGAILMAARIIKLLDNGWAQ
jgi:hypothetical protein